MIKLATRTDSAAGDSLLRIPVQIPTHEEDLELISIAKTGDIAARNELIVRHLPAIIQFAGGFYKDHGSPLHVEVEDLIHVGVFGVIHAIKKYDRVKARGRFICYARFWMRNYMGKALNTYRMYFIPETTRFAYSRGTLDNPATKRAIEHFRDIGSLENGSQVMDNRLSPEEEAIMREEIDRAGSQ